VVPWHDVRATFVKIRTFTQKLKGGGVQIHEYDDNMGTLSLKECGKQDRNRFTSLLHKTLPSVILWT